MEDNFDTATNLEDELENDIDDFPEKPSRRKTHKSKIKEKQKHKRLAKLMMKWWFSPFYPVDKENDWTDDIDDAKMIKHQYRGERSKFLKEQANKKVRQTKEEIPSGNWYKRLFDWDWKMW